METAAWTHTQCWAGVFRAVTRSRRTLDREPRRNEKHIRAHLMLWTVDLDVPKCIHLRTLKRAPSRRKGWNSDAVYLCTRTLGSVKRVDLAARDYYYYYYTAIYLYSAGRGREAAAAPPEVDFLFTLTGTGQSSCNT